MVATICLHYGLLCQMLVSHVQLSLHVLILVLCLYVTIRVIAPDFSLEFAGFFPREKSRKTREISGTSREKSGK